MAKQVELETRQQYYSNLWFKYRAGRVTASNMKAAYHADSHNPSQSLSRAVCVYQQTNWLGGQKQEIFAQERYLMF